MVSGKGGGDGREETQRNCLRMKKTINTALSSLEKWKFVLYDKLFQPIVLGKDIGLSQLFTIKTVDSQGHFITNAQ